MRSKTFAEECGELHDAWLQLLEAALFPAMLRVLGWLNRTAVIFNDLGDAIEHRGKWLLRHPWTFALTLGALGGLAYALLLAGSGR